MRVEGRAECQAAAALQGPGFSRSPFQCEQGNKGQGLGEELQVLTSFSGGPSLQWGWLEWVMLGNVKFGPC